MPPECCPNCDAEVPDGARACPECGADESTGWSQSAHCDRLGIPDPDEAFNHDEFVRHELSGNPPGQRRPAVWWTLTAAVLVIVVLLWLF
jgi:hypothetical protein